MTCLILCIRRRVLVLITRTVQRPILCLQLGFPWRYNGLNQRNQPLVLVHVRDLEPTPLKELGELRFRPLH